MGDPITRSSADTGTVGVRVPAELDQLIMLRALAETVALIGDFALDELTDIRVAVDEVATALIIGAIPDSCVDCEFEFDAERMRVRMAAVALGSDAFDENGFSWQVLHTITENLAAQSSPFDAASGGYPVSVEFCRPRGPGA
ncbi:MULTISPECIES: anti-sigma factor [unclassified Nocardia]|uniref:anti-sigma factor n=1 Tax=unclassified Nocardia TaxID=2637762 RepID=UPI0035DE2D17